MIQTLAALLIFITSSAAAAAPIGSVTELINNPASIQRQNSIIAGIKGTGVEMNDAIKTGLGKIGITFEDDTKVQVNENSKLVIDDFVYDPKSKAGKLGAKIALGTVRYASGQIAKNSPQNVALKTPTATISVRGTDFTASVDELGQSTIILLPSCPSGKPARNKEEISLNCTVGMIMVESDAGQVMLNQAFQATKVNNSNVPPTRPVILNLTESAISNILIVTPTEIAKDDRAAKSLNTANILDVNFLKEQGVITQFESVKDQWSNDKTDALFLNTGFVNGLVEIVNSKLTEKILSEIDPVLPDYKKSPGLTIYKDSSIVGLCRDDGSNQQCITTPLTQNSTVYQIQGTVEFRNRINSGTGTTITLIQR